MARHPKWFERLDAIETKIAGVLVGFERQTENNQDVASDLLIDIPKGRRGRCFPERCCARPGGKEPRSGLADGAGLPRRDGPWLRGEWYQCRAQAFSPLILEFALNPKLALS